MVGRLRAVDQFVWKAFALVEPHASFTLTNRHSPLATRADAVDVRSLFTFCNNREWAVANRHAGPSDVKGWSMVCAPFRAVGNPYRHWPSPALPRPTEPAACFFAICLSSFASRDAQESPLAGLAIR
jgi:hypothetical protein